MSLEPPSTWGWILHPFIHFLSPLILALMCGGHGGRSEPILARVNSQWGEFHFWVNHLVVNCLLVSFFFFFSKSLNTSLQHKNFTPIKKSFRMRRKNIIPVKAEFLFQCQSFTVDIFIYLFHFIATIQFRSIQITFYYAGDKLPFLTYTSVPKACGFWAFSCWLSSSWLCVTASALPQRLFCHHASETLGWNKGWKG